MAGNGARPAWRRAALTSSALGAVAAVVVGPLVGRPPDDWRWLALALCAATFAQFGVLSFRQGARVVLFAWGEAGLIVVIYLVPTSWVPLVIGVGWVVGHALYILRTGATWTRRRWLNGVNITVTGAVGAFIARAIWMADDRGPVTGRVVIALLAGATAYAIVGAVLVSVLMVTTTEEPFWLVVGRTLLAKAPMSAGNAAIGLLVVAVMAASPGWLLLVPPLVVAVHQLYVYRSREADGRRIWREYAEFSRSLHQLDERGVAMAGVEGALSMFDAAGVEVWVERLTGAVRGFRGTPDDNSRQRRAHITPLAGSTSDWLTPPTATRALSIDGIRVGELRLWMAAGGLDSRAQVVLSAVADALAASLHDAAAHRALRTLAARTFHEARHDTLTGIPNRAALMREGEDMIGAIPAGGHVSLLVIGIDRFKDVNDTLGHLAGDDLLRTTAGRLAAFVTAGELLARIGGDEFAILTSGAANGHGDPTAPVLARAYELAEQLAVPTEIAGMQVAVEASVGVAIARCGEVDLVELVRRANLAMYRAKRGAGPVAAFDEDARAGEPSGVERLSVLVEMREALGRQDQLVLAVQPAIDLFTGRPIGNEVLIRWKHPRRGLLAPRDFLDVVDHSDLVAPFTRYVLDRALSLARDWARGGVPLPVSVNLSPRSLTDPSLPFDVATLLTRYQIEPEMLILEITESAVATGQVAGVLAELRGIGVRLAVDDFGTGYSSLTFLTRVKVDEVKVDASFVGQMVDSPEAAAIVRTTVDLGRRLGLRVVAEGIETAAQRDALTALGCCVGQGWHLARPVEADESLDLLRSLVAAAPLAPM